MSESPPSQGGLGWVFHIAIAGYEDITKPERVVVFFEPCCGAQGLLVATAGELAMALGVELLDVEQYEVDLAEELLYMLIPHATVRVDAGVYAMTLEVAHEGHEGFSLYGGLTAREGYTATLAEEGLLVYRHMNDIFGTGGLTAL